MEFLQLTILSVEPVQKYRQTFTGLRFLSRDKKTGKVVTFCDVRIILGCLNLIVAVACEEKSARMQDLSCAHHVHLRALTLQELSFKDNNCNVSRVSMQNYRQLLPRKSTL